MLDTVIFILLRHACKYKYVHFCKCTNTECIPQNICKNACILQCIRNVHTHFCIQVFAHIHHIQACRSCANVYIYMCKYMYTYIYMCKNTHVYLYMCKNTLHMQILRKYGYIYMCKYIACIHIYMCVHAMYV